LKPVKKVRNWQTMLCIAAAVFDPELYRELFRMLRDRAVNVKAVLRLCRFTASTMRLRSLISKSLKSGKAEDTILYSYWLSFDAAAVAKIKKKYPQVYAFARAHAYEIQIERNACNPYLMKRLICKNLDRVAFISQNAKNGFCSYYQEDFPNACVQYLGSDKEDTGYVARGKKETLTVLTCSSILPVKRLDRMIGALEKWQDGPVHWIHIGDGPDKDMLLAMAQEKLDNKPLVTYEFAGYMENRQVHKRLMENDMDVFVNCSRTEGVPVSIMEAMSVGLPVIAPRMFGIPELVQEDCGLLFEQNDGYENLLQTLKSFAVFSKDEREKMGKAAYEQWEKKFSLQDNLEALFSSARIEK
jgi:glycosyltransferase involved in cell wall biosynthesis